MKKHFIEIAIAIVCILIMLYTAVQWDECVSDGGQFVQGLFRYECVRNIHAK